MSMLMDLIWHDDGEGLSYRSSCAECSYRSTDYDDEEEASAAWFGHVCVRASRAAG